MPVCFICGGIFDLEAKKKRFEVLEDTIAQQTFWNDNDAAQKVIAESNDLRGWLVPYHDLKERAESVKALIVEAYDDDDTEFLEELLEEISSVEEGLEVQELRRMLSGELDKKNCFLSINAGAGGTEACDWTQMLTRMYQRWASRRNWEATVVDAEAGDVAGIKSITIKISGDCAYGYAKAENGVHRLVRISPFDSGNRRHTSFASVEVTPEITDDITIEVRSEELRIDTFRASGAGGQHVNTTDSAVRVTHLPSGIVVSCQQERSQAQNKEMCMKLLKSKLYEKEVTEREDSVKAMSGEKKKIEWGSQIRNYVFQPYTLVKDTRTKIENGNVQAVMDGDIDTFVNGYLKEFG
ncbi:MAG: peptide chain release factor 2 [Waddliaceae bacterium]|nr:peptide chain release factor 2 [Waddliaceae bacterium]MBT3579670.1 peptide chain release factor 2 [Waddliaceae bacterium]MBT4445255.1 peptide chain release factor 2 [Waddliaceae bacterium]MBT6928085.1 peptide chain release factor 2 [Waddliaceae bacterium]MBT7264646.1 peptide chain release factor 2 [Waddliaceae bacterium]